jgi:hypothetical protein
MNWSWFMSKFKRDQQVLIPATVWSIGADYVAFNIKTANGDRMMVMRDTDAESCGITVVPTKRFVEPGDQITHGIVTFEVQSFFVHDGDRRASYVVRKHAAYPKEVGSVSWLSYRHMANRNWTFADTGESAHWRWPDDAA